MASTFIALVIFGFSLIWSTCSADPIAMDNCWRKVWSLTPSCTEMDGSTDSSAGNPRLCVFQSRVSRFMFNIPTIFQFIFQKSPLLIYTYIAYLVPTIEKSAGLQDKYLPVNSLDTL